MTMIDGYYRRLFPKGIEQHIRYWFSSSHGAKKRIWVLACSEYGSQESASGSGCERPRELASLGIKLILIAIKVQALQARRIAGNRHTRSRERTD